MQPTQPTIEESCTAANGQTGSSMRGTPVPPHQLETFAGCHCLRVWQVSLRARKAKWLEWCSTSSYHISLGQLWRSMRMASGAARPHPPIPKTAD
ncbi:hypothetical protein E2C01_039204 [Portunus trituberculatus]|uniref:Uncharacterized protein n=1 Tax=Portunus trituberculatus TaxID=210409 RepID=A0A5B7FJ20_PORTR|nr:hypothetical protein [Portunus trituberculatus]